MAFCNVLLICWRLGEECSACLLKLRVGFLPSVVPGYLTFRLSLVSTPPAHQPWAALWVSSLQAIDIGLLKCVPINHTQTLPILYFFSLRNLTNVEPGLSRQSSGKPLAGGYLETVHGMKALLHGWLKMNLILQMKETVQRNYEMIEIWFSIQCGSQHLTSCLKMT